MISLLLQKISRTVFIEKVGLESLSMLSIITKSSGESPIAYYTYVLTYFYISNYAYNTICTLSNKKSNK